GVRVADLAAYAAVALLCGEHPRAARGLAPAARDRRADRRQFWLSHHVRDRVRLFALDLELGCLHVPDPACGEDAAGLARGQADPIGRPQDHDLRRHPHADPTRRNRPAVLESRPPDPNIERAFAAMADMRFLEPYDQRAEFRETQPLR